MQRHNTDDLQKPNLMTRNVMERSAFIKWTLKIVGAFGVSLLLAGKHHHIGWVMKQLTSHFRWSVNSRAVYSWGNSRVSLGRKERITPTQADSF